MTRSFLNNRGFGVIEGLVGASILAVTALGLGVAINSMAKSRIKTQTASSAVSLESTIITAIQDPAIYQPFKEELRAGNLDLIRQNFFLPAVGWGDGRLRLSLDGQFFSSDGSACSGGFANKSCVLSLKMDIRQDALPPKPEYSFAYSIETNSNVITMAPIGVPPNSSFATESFKLAMPSVAVADDVVGCEELNAVAAKGFSFDTGKLHCLEAPRLGPSPTGDDCPDGHFPVALRVFENRVTFECQALRSVSCIDRFYALNNFMPRSLDPRNPSLPTRTENSRCEFTGLNSVAARTGPVYGRLPLVGTTGPVRAAYGIKNGWFCPSGYRARIVSCTAQVAPTPQTPASPCPVGYPDPCPALVSGAWFGASGNYSDPPVAPINLGQTISSVSGQQATCILDNENQPGLANNKAGWSGFVNMDVACDLDTDEWPLELPSICEGNGCEL